MIETALSGNTRFGVRFVMGLSANQGQGAGTMLQKLDRCGNKLAD